MRLVVVRDRMPLRAAEEPMLMSESKMLVSKEMRTAFKGILDPGVT
jgi:hypothetical protein